MFKAGKSNVVYKANPEDDTWGYLCEPELREIDRHWYIYTSAHQTAAKKDFKHVIVLTAKTDDPYDGFVLGILELVGDDPLSADAWLKDDEPLVVKGNDNYGSGHATFFKSPDESEFWISMHCLDGHNPSVTEMARRCHCQRVFFGKTGFPHIGSPISKSVYYPIPSGDVGKIL